MNAAFSHWTQLGDAFGLLYDSGRTDAKDAKIFPWIGYPKEIGEVSCACVVLPGVCVLWNFSLFFVPLFITFFEQG